MVNQEGPIHEDRGQLMKVMINQEGLVHEGRGKPRES